jgi:surface protein
MERMFNNCDQLQDITPLANWEVSNVKNMQWMFGERVKLKKPNNTNSIKSHLRNLPKRSYPKQDHNSLLNSLWERVKPLLKYTTKLNGYFKQCNTFYLHIEDLPSDWQDMEIPQWNP